MHGELQDAKARQLEETNLFKAVSQMGDMTHTMRRSLKQMRKWCRTHPTEVRLGTCLADYFNIEIPGLRRTEHLEGFKGEFFSVDHQIDGTPPFRFQTY